MISMNLISRRSLVGEGGHCGCHLYRLSLDCEMFDRLKPGRRLCGSCPRKADQLSEFPRINATSGSKSGNGDPL
jgi:hypothetical protein